MSQRPETRHSLVSHLVTGHFHEVAGYATWRPNGTRDWLLVYTVSGSGRFGHRGGTAQTAGGDLVLLAPGALHDYAVARDAGSWQLLWTHFYPRPHWHDLLRWPQVAPGLMRIRLGENSAIARMTDLFLELHRRATSAMRHRELAAMNQLETILLEIDAHNPQSQHAQVDPRIRRAIEHVCADLAARHSVESLAQLAGLSASRLAHLFREQVGQSPQQFVELQRINRAKELLALTSRTIQTIAIDVGFANPFYFTLRFRRHMRMSPREYRRWIERPDLRKEEGAEPSRS